MKNMNESQYRQSVLDAAERLQGKLIRFTSRFFGGDENQARDVVQHAFMQLCQVAEPSRPDHIDAWLFRVCRNRAIDTQRREERVHTGQEGIVMQQIDDRKNANEQLDQQELCDVIQDRMTSLPDSQREAVDLWSNGFRYAEISKIMEKPETTIRVMVHRAIQKLKTDPSIKRWIESEIQTNSNTNPQVIFQRA